MTNDGQAILDRFLGAGAKAAARSPSLWAALRERRCPGRIAVSVGAEQDSALKIRSICAARLADAPALHPAAWTSNWYGEVTYGMACVCAGLQLPGDAFPALQIPRPIFWETQGICDIFGAEVAERNAWWHEARPLPADPILIDEIEPKPLNTSRFYNAVEWIRYARRLTGGMVEFRNPVMTGPFDTANYLLGTTVLMEWVYTQPEVLHRLLDKITGVIVGMAEALREAAGGPLNGDAFGCVANIFCFCSECRSLVSREIYEQFEAPYLRRIGEKTGPYGIHSCGSWERTIPSALGDNNLRAMHGQIRENDLAELCRLADGRMTLAIGASNSLPERYTWPNTRSYLAHVLETVPASQPLELGVSEKDFDLWLSLYREIRGREWMPG